MSKNEILAEAAEFILSRAEGIKHTFTNPITGEIFPEDKRREFVRAIFLAEKLTQYSLEP